MKKQDKVETIRSILISISKNRKLKIEIIFSMIVGFIFSIFVKLFQGKYPSLSPFDFDSWNWFGWVWKSTYLGDFLLGSFLCFLIILLIKLYLREVSEGKKNYKEKDNSNFYKSSSRDNVVNLFEFENKKLSTKDESIEKIVFESINSEGSYMIKFCYDISGNFIIKEEMTGKFVTDSSYEYGELEKVTYNVQIKSKINDTDLYMRSYKKLQEFIKQKKIPITNEFKIFFESLNFKVELYTQNSLK